MRNVGIAALVGLLAVGGSAFAYAGGLNFASADGANRLKISNRLQVRFTEIDPDEGSSEGSFRIRRYKLKFDGQVFNDWKFVLQANFAGGSLEGRNDELLEDAYVQYARNSWAQPWLGQGKSWFGRQFLTSSGSQQFVDRSLASGRFAGQRQIGVGLVGHNENKTFEYNVGLYNGEGINRSSNPGNEYMKVARVVFTPFGEYKLSEGALDYPESSKLAVGVSVYDNSSEASTDTELVVVTDPGTGLPTGAIDEIEIPGSPGTDVRRYGLEVAYKIHGFSVAAEYFDETLDPDTGSDLDTDGYYVQGGYLFPNRKAEVALRYSEVSPDLSPSEDMSEKAVAFSWYFSEHHYKLQADYAKLQSDRASAIDSDVLRVQMQLAF